MNVYEKIIETSDSLEQEMITCRRDLHKYPEIGWFEFRTTSIIAKALTDMGYEVLQGDQVCKRDARMGVPPQAELDAQYERAIQQGAIPEYAEKAKDGMTGVVGILRCGEGKTVAMRFDIDALGIVESKDPDHRPFKEGYRSVNEGFMHACGHDGHTTIGLGVAKVLADIKDSLHGTVKLIFQPAEEGVRGSKAIVENGILDDVDYFLGAHNTDKAPGDPTDLIPGSYGYLATTKYDVVFHGLSAHAGGSPEQGHNVMLALSTAILNLYAIPRHSGGMTRINVGVVKAGSGRNVIADEAFMQMEVRGETTELNEFMASYAMNILNSAAQMHGCTVEIKKVGSANSQTSSPEFVSRIRKVCEDKLHLTVSKEDMVHIGDSEDVSYMVNRVQELGGQASFMRSMTCFAAPYHNRRYEFDESYMKQAVKIFSGVTYDLLK